MGYPAMAPGIMETISMSRLVCWYSNGAASLVAAKKAIEMQPDRYPGYEIVVARIYIKDEYHEPERDELVEEFLGHKIVDLRDQKYDASVDTVIEKTRYMAGVAGARCTKELKKNVRLAWQRDGDVHVFGFDCKEGERRVNNLLDTEPEIEYFTPLMELEMTKMDCFVEMNNARIPLPKMYQLGYHNNNCVGCLKASGAGYWNKVRKDFPEVFEKRSKQEKYTGAKLVNMSKRDVIKHNDELLRKAAENLLVLRFDKNGRVRVPLSVLPEGAMGSHTDLDIGDCGFICEIK